MNKEKMLAKRRAYARAYRAAHRDEMLAYQCAYCKAYREEIRVCQRVYRAAQREEKRAKASREKPL